VWNHLFLNIYDQHGDVHNGVSVTGLNKYGPLLVELSTDALVSIPGEVLGYSLELTKHEYDPAKHDVRTLEDFRQQTFRDVGALSRSGDAARRPGTRGPNMCVHVEGSGIGVPFKPHLQRVIVDQFPPNFSGLQAEVLNATWEAIARCAPTARVEHLLH
jgi:hypothetical protein